MSKHTPTDVPTRDRRTVDQLRRQAARETGTHPAGHRLRRTGTVLALAAVSIVAGAGIASAHPVLDGPVTYCGPTTHWSFGHCVPTARPTAPGRRAI